jgi:hypothetical protein
LFWIGATTERGLIASFDKHYKNAEKALQNEFFKPSTIRGICSTRCEKITTLHPDVA